jgi:hypothetical protein
MNLLLPNILLFFNNQHLKTITEAILRGKGTLSLIPLSRIKAKSKT